MPNPSRAAYDLCRTDRRLGSNRCGSFRCAALSSGTLAETAYVVFRSLAIGPTTSPCVDSSSPGLKIQSKHLIVSVFWSRYGDSRLRTRLNFRSPFFGELALRAEQRGFVLPQLVHEPGETGT